MTTIRTLITCSVGALIVAGGLTGCTAGGPRTARLGEGSGSKAAAVAPRVLADRTRRMLAQHDGDGAVALAERLVAAAPHQAAYRALLGQSYLQAGRFASARQAFADALQLDPADGRSALNLSLAMIAGGNAVGARALLERHGANIPAADLGLAMALAGAPADGVRILTVAAREQGASVKTRQNLALSLALAGQWDMARMAASADMAAADVEVRMQEWAGFAAATNPADQVASLLGIRRASDSGQPLTLALNATPSVAVMQEMAQALPQPVDTRVAERPEVPAAQQVLFAAPQAVVQPVPMVADRSPVRMADAAPPAMIPARRDDVSATRPDARIARLSPGLVTTPALLRRAEERRPLARPKGDWNVQIGAFGEEEGARKAWGELTRRFTGLADYIPQSGTVQAATGSLYRLSVGGLVRTEADALCRRYRDAGGACFVRRQADDRMAHWARPGMGLAAL